MIHPFWGEQLYIFSKRAPVTPAWKDSRGERNRWLMAKSRAEQMVERLRDFQQTEGVEASAIVSVDGLSMASALPSDVEEDRVSAMSAAMLSLGERIAGELRRGNLEQVYIRGATGHVLVMAVGDEAVLTTLAREDAKLGLVLLDMRRTAEDLAKLL